VALGDVSRGQTLIFGARPRAASLLAPGRAGSFRAVSDEFRVEVELDDDEHGYSIRERLRAHDLDDDARRRLGSGVLVTRDGSRLFLYAASEPQAREAERVVRELADADGLTADIRVTRWHPVEEDWKDASLPLPATSDELAAEEAAHEAAEVEEARLEGQFDWNVVAHAASRDGAVELAERLRAEGVHVTRRFRYVVAGVPTEEQAEELAERIRAELAQGGDVRVEADLSDLPRGPLQFLSIG
jgi:hypothetical protein